MRFTETLRLTERKPRMTSGSTKAQGPGETSEEAMPVAFVILKCLASVDRPERSDPLVVHMGWARMAVEPLLEWMGERVLRKCGSSVFGSRKDVEWQWGDSNIATCLESRFHLQRPGPLCLADVPFRFHLRRISAHQCTQHWILPYTHSLTHPVAR